jgi:hypothetical protein
MKDHHMIHAFSHALHQSSITTEQTLLLSHLAITHDEKKRTTFALAQALTLNPITVGRCLKRLHAHDLIDRPHSRRPFQASTAGHLHLRDIATRIKNALQKPTP